MATEKPLPKLSDFHLQVSELEVFTTFRLSARLRVNETLNLGINNFLGVYKEWIIACKDK